MSTVLVTGGAGFIGSHLVDALLASGEDVRVLDDLSTGSLRNLQAAADRHAAPANGHRGPHLELMIGDIQDERLVRKAMRHVGRVFHMAALPATPTPARPTAVHSVNVQGTLNVLQAATAEGVRRVVFASCASVYGDAAGGPLAEDCAPHPATVFGASKLAGEIYCRAYQTAHQLETVILRYFTVYGPRQSGGADGAVVPTLVATLRHRRRPIIFGDGRAPQDLMYVDDAVAVTLAAAGSPEAGGRVINVASGQITSPIEVLDILNRLLRTDAVPRLTRPRSGQLAPARARVALAEEVLGCRARVSLVAGLERVVQAYAEHQEDGLLAEVGPREERADV